jgi:arylsulfatase A-like enzyme
VILTSDHGDQDGAHRLEHKSFFYEESIRVPLIVQWKGVINEGITDKTHLVSTGLDIIPTMCQAAGVQTPQKLKGESLLPVLKGESNIRWRDHLIVERHMARMVHMGKWKYMVGRDKSHDNDKCLHCKKFTGSYEPKVREMLIDLESDPGEMNNRAEDPKASIYLSMGRKLLRDWMESNTDNMDTHYLV